MRFKSLVTGAAAILVAAVASSIAQADPDTYGASGPAHNPGFAPLSANDDRLDVVSPVDLRGGKLCQPGRSVDPAGRAAYDAQYGRNAFFDYYSRNPWEYDARYGLGAYARDFISDN